MSTASLLQKLEALPKGPSYVDDQQCRCTLQSVNVLLGDSTQQLVQEAWRCTQNQTNNAYWGASGKWFVPANLTANGTDFVQYIDWDGNPPDLTNAYALQGYDNRTDGTLIALTDSNNNLISSDDQICTGNNDTEASSIAYQHIKEQVRQNNTQIHQTCARGRDVTSFDILNSTAFVQSGCPLGFLCRCSLE
jgi:hypothetical protein